jgi:hypothetical protein
LIFNDNESFHASWTKTLKMSLMNTAMIAPTTRIAASVRRDLFLKRKMIFMTRSFWRERLGPWSRSLPGLLFLGFFSGGCAGPAVVVEQPSVKAVPSTDVGRMQAWRDAEDVTARDESRVTVIGAGDSMLPVYGEGTVLVLHKIPYADLETGMQVAYINEAGHQVVHVLVSYDAGRRGWRVRGLNNEDEDRERVTPYNLIGVVYASFAPGEGIK